MITPIPSFSQGFATRQNSLYPHLWKGVIGAWSPFLGRQGNKLFDWSGYKKNGVNSGATWIVEKNGLTLNFLGTIPANDHIDIQDTNFFSFGDGANDRPFSIVVSLKTSGQRLGSNFFGIVSKDNGLSQREWSLLVSGATGKLRLLLINDLDTTNGFTYLNSTNGIHDGLNHVIITTYDGRGGADAIDGANLWLDGKVDTDGTARSSYTAMRNGTTNIELGRYTSASFAFTGNINWAIIYNRVILQRTIVQLSTIPFALFQMKSPDILGLIPILAGIVPFRRRIEEY